MKRSFALALAGCVAGAGLALYAATRTWSVHVVERPGLPELRSSTTGADQAPWLVGLALVALAGAGALLATRGLLRRLLGGLLALAGAGVATGAIYAATGHVSAFWPVACAIGGALIVAAGVTAARHGRSWPIMGARYERTSAPAGPAKPGGRSGPLAASGLERGETRDQEDTRAVWDALDRGDDPTLG